MTGRVGGGVTGRVRVSTYMMYMYHTYLGAEVLSYLGANILHVYCVLPPVLNGHATRLAPR